jgi:CRP-like cAMP-binding protein
MNRRDVALAQKTQRGPGRHIEAASRAHAGNREAADERSIDNSLLVALPHAVKRRLLAAGLESVTLKFGEVLHEPDVPIPYVYFPIDCVIALLMPVKSHRALKVGLVGNEGMVGSPVALGILTSSRRALVQGAGTAMRMESALFRKEVLRSKPLQRALYRYKHALVGQIAQSAACKHFHSVQERFARYLLMISDCARSMEIRLTHEFLAHMLGVRRVGITTAAGALQKRKLIKCGRGKITILDRKRLSTASCECYQVIKRMHDGAYADG